LQELALGQARGFFGDDFVEVELNFGEL